MSYSQELIAERYRLVSQIGAGGMGRVWLARDEMLHRDVAIKEVLLPPDLTDGERVELFQRTLREARAAGRLNHPNVVAVHDVVQAEDRPWIVMELVRSRSLYQMVKEDGPVAPKRAAEIGLAILAALRAAHAAGVWHRDVKPGNVLLADDGRVVLTDFGLATFDGDGTVTRSGIILGSAQYISPERARDGSSGPEADMWSLGATLYAAVEGRSPFARESSMATLTALATEPPDPPKHAGALRPLLIGLLRKNPRQRMDAIEAERLLQRVVDGTAKVVGRKSGRIPLQRDAPVETTPPPAATPPATGDDDSPRPAGTRTVTEETYRQPVRARTRWGLIGGLAVVVLALIAPGAYLIVTSGRSAPVADAASPSASASATGPVLTEAMRVQACPMQASVHESALPPDSANNGLPPYYTMYHDSSGYGIGIPDTWRVSKIGNLVCFRDPTSAKAIAVFSHGKITGNPLELMSNTKAWEAAADMTDFQKLLINDAGYPEGAANLEYSYERDGIRMHGRNRMLRMNGEVFTIYFLSTEVSWSTDRAIVDVIQPSFTLAD